LFRQQHELQHGGRRLLPLAPETAKAAGLDQPAPLRLRKPGRVPVSFREPVRERVPVVAHPQPLRIVSVGTRVDRLLGKRGRLPHNRPPGRLISRAEREPGTTRLILPALRHTTHPLRSPPSLGLKGKRAQFPLWFIHQVVELTGVHCTSADGVRIGRQFAR